ncbi:MAG: hypothetical protein QNJ31_00580 [Candidatus Caenarcaniphilales bacterium]|nr:hypothetical protein [Candidatus Caenarcaniphilales bacterium]
MKFKRLESHNIFPKLFIASFAFLSLASNPTLSLEINTLKDKNTNNYISNYIAEKKVSKKKAQKAKTIKNIVEGCKKNIELADLVANPEFWVGKEVCIQGNFSSFSALALDYPPALRERKNYISLTLLRPKTSIPLGELKIAMKIKEAQNHEVLPKISKGDVVEIKGKAFSAALGEPWVDVIQIKVIKDANSKDGDELNFLGN